MHKKFKYFQVLFWQLRFTQIYFTSENDKKDDNQTMEKSFYQTYLDRNLLIIGRSLSLCFRKIEGLGEGREMIELLVLQEEYPEEEVTDASFM